MNINKGITQRNNTPANPVKDLQSVISSKGMEAQLRAALPSVITPERFTRLVLTAISTTPKLAQCTRESFFGAIFQAAQLGLEPNTPTGQAYLVPYGNQCQFVLGYRGQIQLAYRSGEITDISAHVVHENDEFEYELGLTPKLVHKPKFGGKRGAPVAAYAVYHTKSGGYGMEVMSWDDVLEFAKKKSRAYGNGPWKTDPEEMAKKTVVKKLLKYAPISADFARAMAADETVKNFDPSKDRAADLLDEEGVVTIENEENLQRGAPEEAREEPERRQRTAGTRQAEAPEDVPLPEEEEIPMDWGAHSVDPKTGEVRA